MRSRRGVEFRRRFHGAAILCAGFLALAVAAAAETAPAPAAPAAPALAAPIGIVPPIPTAGTLPGLGSLPDSGELQMDVKNIRNPFRPFIAIDTKKGRGGPKAKGEKAFVPQTPLQRFALEDLKFVGVVWSKSTLKGLIEDPKGKGYTVAPGTYVGDRGGKIVKIHPDRMIVEEYGVDVLGEETVREITIQLHKSENEVNP